MSVPSKSKPAVGAAVSTAASAFEYFVGMLTSILIARHLSADQFGLLSYVVWLTGLLVVVGNHGTMTTAVKFIAEALGAGDSFAARLIGQRLGGIQLWSVTAVVAVSLSVTAVFEPSIWGPQISLLLLLTGVATMARARYSFLSGVALGHHKFYLVAASTSLSAVVYLISSLLVSMQSGSVLAYCCCYVLASLFMVIMVRAGLRSEVRRTQTLPYHGGLLERVRKHLGWTALLALGAQSSNRALETLLLGIWGTRSEVAFFAIAGTLTRGAVELITSGLQTTLMPLMAHASTSQGRTQVDAMLNAAMRYYWWAGLVVMACGSLGIAPFVLDFYGHAYSPTVAAAQLTLIGAGLGLPTSALGAFQSILNRQKDRVLVTFLMAAVNALAAFILIPAFGLLGAAACFGLTRVSGLVLSVISVRRVFGSCLEWRPQLRMVGAACLAAPVSLVSVAALPATYGGFLAALLFLPLFTMFTVLLRCWYVADFRLAASVLAYVPGPLGRCAPAVGRLSARFALS